ncbi:Hemin transport system permease protein HmuU [subsurface metagenome]|nr:iron chelate uptake ABC transporter family permease subunit [Clostridia bacterium]
MKVLSLKKWLITIVLLTILLIVTIIFCSFQGSADIKLKDLLEIFSNSPSQTWWNTKAIILLKVRLPRILLACMVGGALAVSGVVLQALLRNPLADPYILGVSSGSALGAIIAILLGLNITIGALPLIPLFGFVGGLLTILFVYHISKIHRKISIQTMLLVGVVTGAILAAIIMFITSMAGPHKVQGIIFWLMGSLSSQEYPMVVIVSLYVIVGILILLYYARSLNLLVLGEESATQLGLEVERTKKIAFIGASLITGAAVSVSGLIGFVGILIPHLMRMIIGSDHRLLLPAAGLFGSIYLILADTLARTLMAPTEIPVGVITAICGGPFFIYLLRKKKTIFFH